MLHMERLCYFFMRICCLLVAISNIERGYSQSNANYIMSETFLDIQGTNTFKDYQFFDGLGNKTIEASNSNSNNGEYIYLFNEVNGLQQVLKKWLPVIGNTNINAQEVSSISSDAFSQYNDSYAYSLIEYDMTGKPVKEINAGRDWHQNSKSSQLIYLINQNEVRHYSALIKGENRLQDLGYYQPGTLSAVCREDEDGQKLTVYTDVHGRKILERRGVNNDTYFVYNDFGLLIFVLTPMYQEENSLEKYAYEYRYDVKGNIISKSIPGCKEIKYWYNKYNELVAIQDDNLRIKGKFRVIFYDELGRLAIQMITTSLPNDADEMRVKHVLGSGGIEGTDYRLVSDKLSDFLNVNLEIVKYYDTYDFLAGTSKKHFSGLSVSSIENAQGMNTGVIISVSNGEFLSKVIRYDLLGNILESKTRGLNGRIEDIANTYTFTNQINKSVINVDVGYGELFKQSVNYTYHKKNDKLIKKEYNLEHGSSPIKVEIAYEYDQLGRIKNIIRPLGGSYYVSNKLSYEYDIHGWVKKITSKTFKEDIYYADGYGTPNYNGNISSIIWQDNLYGNNFYGNNKGYIYKYDELNRLTHALYGEDNFSKCTDQYNEVLSYDKNGNMNALQRTGKMQDGNFGLVDDLHVQYNGNQPCSVIDNAHPVFFTGSLDMKSGSNDIAYNGNGSLIMDGTRYITKIEYDNGNNPIRIQFDNGNVTKYVYAITGEKLRTIHYTALPNIHVEMGKIYADIERTYLSADSTDYRLNGQLVMENGHIKKVLFDDGYCQATGCDKYLFKPLVDGNTPKGWKWVKFQMRMKKWREAVEREKLKDCFTAYFYIKDHLGSIRQVVSTETGIDQVNSYYPFGIPYHKEWDIAFLKYRYNGKEFDMMHGLNTYDYGARQYNPILPIWDRVDPLCEKYYNVSPYMYCLGNPVKLVDLDGAEPTEEEAARIAHHVYQTDAVRLIGGWKVSNRSIQKVILNDGKSGFKSALYERRTASGTTEYVYATAGTDITSGKDWLNNIGQIVGQSKQYALSIRNADKISEDLGGKELTFVGHSLGGGLAAANAYTTGRNALTFNAAWISPFTIAWWNRKSVKIDAFVHIKDELNLIQQKLGVSANGNRHWRFKTRSVLGHSIENFYPTDYELVKQMLNTVEQMNKDLQQQYMMNRYNFPFTF